MNIQGLQKLTLLDFPGKTAATVFTCGCNLRCPFCHNASLVVGDPGSDNGGFTFTEEGNVDEEDVFALLAKRKGLLDGVAITGGEPLLHRELAGFMAGVKDRGFLVKLDTNGFLPDRLKYVLEAGLVDYVAMDVKHSPEKYGEAAGISGISFEPFAKSIEIIKGSGVPYEFRTTIVKGLHTLPDVEEICRRIGPDANYFLQMYVDSGDVLANREAEGGAGFEAFSQPEAEGILAAARAIVPGTGIRGL